MAERYHRKVFRIRAEDSPNVRLGLAERQKGKSPSDTIVVPGILPWSDYEKRRALWDKVRQCIGLDAQFWEGAEVLLFPPDWLNRAEAYHETLKGRFRKARGIGIDPAEGGDSTSMAAVDDFGLIELVSKKTPNTAVITGEAIAFLKRHGVTDCSTVCFDRGGGGKQHADRLREQGYPVRTIAFGESIALEPRRRLTMVEERIEIIEERYVYINRRAQMYGELRSLMDPGRLDNKGMPIQWGLPPEYHELRRQLALIPLTIDKEGRLYLLPKSKKDPKSRERTLIDILGCSPDEADATVLAVHGARSHTMRAKAGAV